MRGLGGDIEIRIVVPFSDCVVPSVLLENMTQIKQNKCKAIFSDKFQEQRH